MKVYLLCVPQIIRETIGLEEEFNITIFKRQSSVFSNSEKGYISRIKINLKKYTLTS